MCHSIGVQGTPSRGDDQDGHVARSSGRSSSDGSYRTTDNQRVTKSYEKPVALALILARLRAQRSYGAAYYATLPP